jgi:hypothetical protein
MMMATPTKSDNKRLHVELRSDLDLLSDVAAERSTPHQSSKARIELGWCAAVVDTAASSITSQLGNGTSNSLDVVFSDQGPMGIKFRNKSTGSGDRISIEEIAPMCPCQARLRAGLMLTHIAGCSILDRKFEEVMRDLRAAPRPLTVTFFTAGSISDYEEQRAHLAQGEKPAATTDDKKGSCIAACVKEDPPVDAPHFASPPQLGEASRVVLDNFASWKNHRQNQALFKEHVALCKDMFDSPSKFGLPAGITASQAHEQICLREHALGEQAEALERLVRFQVSGLVANGKQL